VVGENESAACGCEDGLAILGLEGRELPAVEFFECNCFIFCFYLANATSLAEAFLYVILGEVELRKNVHVCLSHMELQRLQGCALATRCLHHFVCAVSEGFEPSRAERMLMYHGDRRSCSETSGQEMCFLAMLRNGDGLVLRTRR